MDLDQFRSLVKHVLWYLEPVIPYSKNAEELLILTAKVESDLGYYLEQVGGGSAEGMFQMEPRTEKDIWEWFIKLKTDLSLKMLNLQLWSADVEHWNLRYVLPYQVAMARCHYRRFSEPLPDYRDVEGMAKYWKKYYNTYLGKGTVEEAIKKYRSLYND